MGAFCHFNLRVHLAHEDRFKANTAERANLAVRKLEASELFSVYVAFINFLYKKRFQCFSDPRCWIATRLLFFRIAEECNSCNGI